MSLLDALGLGALGFSPPNYQQSGIGAYPSCSYQPYPVYYPVCPHGIDCPMCAENAKKVAEEIKRQEELKTQKKLDYEKRYKEWMKKLHGGIL